MASHCIYSLSEVREQHVGLNKRTTGFHIVIGVLQRGVRGGEAVSDRLADAFGEHIGQSIH